MTNRPRPAYLLLLQGALLSCSVATSKETSRPRTRRSLAPGNQDRGAVWRSRCSPPLQLQRIPSIDPQWAPQALVTLLTSVAPARSSRAHGCPRIARLALRAARRAVLPAVVRALRARCCDAGLQAITSMSVQAQLAQLATPCSLQALAAPLPCPWLRGYH